MVLGPLDGLPRESAVNLDHLQTVPRARIGAAIAKITAGRLDEVQRALLFALGFDHAERR